MLFTRGWKNNQKKILVLGFFDGLHRGHQKVLKEAYDAVLKRHLTCEVITLYPHPENFFAGKRNYPIKYLTTYGEKYSLLKRFFPGMSLRFIRFARSLQLTPPPKFLEHIFEELHPHMIFIGENFRFGREAKGDAQFLRQYFQKEGVEVVIVPPLKEGDLCISSSTIRELITRGDLLSANRLLGYPFTFIGRVRKGKQLASRLGFPTANLYPSRSKILPPYGVYITQVWWSENMCGFPALTYIGCKPTFGRHRQVVETFIPSLNSVNLYEKRLIVQLVAFMRGERVFSSPQELKKQIDLDIEAFQQYLQGKNSVINYPLNAIVEV